MNCKIALIIPYFGKWPEWIELYLYSCSKNEFIDWYFFTDCEKVDVIYKNLHFIYLSFEEYCYNVSKKLGIDFKPMSAYKLCDLKPFYGYIHQDILKGYDFWGFADVDVIWGNIKDFYSDNLLSKYDVFSTHNDRLSGHLCILRNNLKYTNLCFRIQNWQTKLESEQNFALDEGDLSRIIFPQSKIIGKFYRQIMMKFLGWKLAWETYYTFFPFIHAVFQFKKRKLYFREQHTTPILSSDGTLYKYEAENWFYENGKITNDRTKKEYIYLHFMIYKKNNFRADYFWKDDFYHLKTSDFTKKILINKQGLYAIETK